MRPKNKRLFGIEQVIRVTKAYTGVSKSWEHGGRFTELVIECRWSKRFRYHRIGMLRTRIGIPSSLVIFYTDSIQNFSNG